ncbi:MAG TPA: VWA domain-containing protein [Acidimicrobiales bacterium]
MLALSFLAPSRLWLLLLPVLLLAAYVVSQLRRRGYVVRFTTMDLLDSVAPKRPRWRRHLPAIGLLLGLVALSLSLAKPAVAQQTADKRGVVVLAMDTSLSMEATDVAPSRLAAAQDAARTFLKNVPNGVRVGLVSFDNGARLIVPPTDKTAVVERGISRLQLGEGTAIGEAVFTSLDAIDEALNQTPKASDQTTNGSGSTSKPGEKPAAIVLLSDGENTVGRSNDEAATAASAAGRPVYTVAVGTDGGTVQLPDGTSQPVPVNRAALADLASKTGARSFTAYSSDELRSVYKDLGRTLTKEPVQKDVSGWFVGGAMAFLALAALGSLIWFARLP